MFKLVGREHFTVSKAKCCITIDAVSGFAYEYTLDVNGKPLKKFQENQSKIMKTWVAYVAGNPTRVVLGELWCFDQLTPCLLFGGNLLVFLLCYNFSCKRNV